MSSPKAIGKVEPKVAPPVIGDPETTPFDAVLAAWTAWDAAYLGNRRRISEKGDRQRAVDLVAAVDLLAAELGMPSPWIRRRMSAGRRAGTPHLDVLEALVAEAQPPTYGAVA